MFDDKLSTPEFELYCLDYIYRVLDCAVSYLFQSVVLVSRSRPLLHVLYMLFVVVCYVYVLSQCAY